MKKKTNACVKSCKHQRTAGTLVAMMAVLFLLLTSSCSSYSGKPEPVVYEHPNVLSDSLRATFCEFDFPNGVVPVLVANQRIGQLITTGVEADTLFDYLSDSIKISHFEEYGLMVMVTENPRLIQVRLGSHYDLYAGLCGVTMGLQYLEIQQEYMEGRQDSAMRAMLTMICDNIRQRQALSWYQRGQLSGVSQGINYIMEWFGTPSKNLFGTFVTKPVYFLISIGAMLFGSWIWGIVLVFLVVVGGRYLLLKLFHRLIPSPTWRDLLGKLAGWAFGLVFSMSAAGCAMVFSNGRLEDLMAIKAFGIPGVESFIADPSMFVQETSFLMAGAFFFLMVFARAITNDYCLWAMLPSTIQRKQWDSIGGVSQSISQGLQSVEVKKDDPAPYLTLYHGFLNNVSMQVGGLSTAALFFFPKAVLWTGIAYSLAQIILKAGTVINVIKGSYRYHKLGDKTAAENVMSALGVAFLSILLGTALTLALSWFIDPFDKRGDAKKAAETEVVSPVIMKKVQVTAKTANLRTGPGTSYSKLTEYADGTGRPKQVRRGEQLEVIEEVSGWYKISLSGDSRDAYIKKTLCKDLP